MKAADYLAKAIEELDIPYVFGLPGSTEAPFLQTLNETRSFEYILTLHENVTVAMADGYARASGKVGIANLHTTVGTGNGISQLYNASRDRSSLVVLAGHKSTDIYNRDGFCTIDHLPNLTKSITKWSGELENSTQIVDDFYRAVKISKSSPMGPVFLSLPENLLGREIEHPLVIDPERRVLPVNVSPLPSDIKHCSELLNSSNRVVIIAGDDVAHTDAIECLEEVARKLNAVVLREPRRSSTKFTYSTENPHFSGEYAPSHPAVKEADCIFAVGCRLFVEFGLPKAPEIQSNITIIHVHENPNEIAKLYPVTLGMVGSSRTTLEQLLPLLNTDRNSLEWVNKNREKYLSTTERPPIDNNSKPMKVSDVVCVMSNILPEEAIIVDEGIRSSRALLKHFPFRYSNSYHTTSGGALGWGIPAAIGIQFAQPDKQVVAFIGDGSALFTIQGLWTAAKYNLPVIFMICNNKTYLAVKAAIKEYRKNVNEPETSEYPASSLAHPTIDFVSIAKGLGVHGEVVTNLSKLESILKTAINSKEPILLDVQVEEVEV
ncbi:thiamine pyrophosphate-binding protein [Bacillus sp. Marseille-P3661]|uniref:thiamine pyrophosphate-binding protein n=1 Tax=Bacillus sp. Marseille-P3661 TaxID=1936234 RepID=UPI000C85BB97|nr:thiamine pyrophosphate-binding protein [Bacillus sp. Marseille-P3661]